MKQILLLILASWIPAITGTASPVERKDVAADCSWVFHIDFDGVRPTTLGRFLLSEMAKPESRAKWTDTEATFGFSVLTNVHGLTLYGNTNFDLASALLVYGDFHEARPVGKMKTNDYQLVVYKQTSIHSWLRDKKHRNYAAPVGGHLLVCGENLFAIQHALDALDRSIPNLSATHRFPQLGENAETSFVQGAARKMEVPLTDPNALLLRMLRETRLNAGESEGKITASLKVSADDSSAAEQMLTIARGLLGLAKYQHGKPELAKLAELVLLEQTGADFAANLSLPVSDVIAAMKAADERKSQKDRAK